MTFSYIILTREGKEVKGTLEADSLEKATEKLKVDGNTLISLEEANALSKEVEIGIFRKKPKPRDMAVFCRNAKAQALSQQTLFDPAMEVRDDLIYFSCLPWFPITGFVTERNLDVNDCIPRVTWGKYQNRGERFVLNVTVEVNHRTVDGVHLGTFYEALQAGIDRL